MPVRSWPKISQFSSQKHRQAKNHMYRKNYVFETLTLVKCTARFATFHASQVFFYLHSVSEWVRATTDVFSFGADIATDLAVAEAATDTPSQFRLPRSSFEFLTRRSQREETFAFYFRRPTCLKPVGKDDWRFKREKNFFFHPFRALFFHAGLSTRQKWEKEKHFFFKERKKKVFPCTAQLVKFGCCCCCCTHGTGMKTCMRWRETGGKKKSLARISSFLRLRRRTIMARRN